MNWIGLLVSDYGLERAVSSSSSSLFSSPLVIYGQLSLESLKLSFDCVSTSVSVSNTRTRLRVQKVLVLDNTKSTRLGGRGRVELALSTQANLIGECEFDL